MGGWVGGVKPEVAQFKILVKNCLLARKYDKVPPDILISITPFTHSENVMDGFDSPHDSASENAGRAPLVFTVTTSRLACDGGGGALGHPKIYLDLTHSGQVDCPYCGRRFVYNAAQIEE